MSQARALTAAEETLISLVENNSKDENFAARLNEAIRSGSGKNPQSRDERIFFTEADFMNAFRKRVLQDKFVSTQALFEICKALCQQKTFGSDLIDAPLRTGHVFNYIYESLVSRHKFYVDNEKVSEKIPEDINAIHYELLQFFRKAVPNDSEQTMCNCILVKIDPKATMANRASGDLIEQLAGGIRELKEPPVVTQEYFDRVNSMHERKGMLTKGNPVYDSPLPSRKLDQAPNKKDLDQQWEESQVPVRKNRSAFFKPANEKDDIKRAETDPTHNRSTRKKEGRGP